jgi:aminopeptidase N
MSMTKSIRKLSTFFRPESYDIKISIYPDSMTFKGQATISGLKLGPPSHRLTFHQQYLKISSATITRHHKLLKQSMTIDRINHHKSFNEVRLHTREQLYGGNYRVIMNFSGLINDDIKDILLGSLKTKKKMQVNVNQFENYFARKLFPCIDDPEIKVNTSLTLISPKQTVVIPRKPDLNIS